MDSAFYVADGDRFVSTELTRGPWDPDAQHAGPPAALLGRALERCPSPLDEGAEPPPRQVARVTFDILRSVPIAPLTVSAEVVRPGRSVELLAASLADERGEVIRASAWRLVAGGVELPEGLGSEDPANPARGTEPRDGPEAGTDAITIPEPTGVGLADTALHDERGPIGRSLQTLLVRER
jgi:acyl-CoA thioesterase superfamily protein